MQPIKFRGKTKQNDIWVYGYFWKSPDGVCWIKDKTGADFEVIEKTVGQYTGFKSKNKKEIYNGDILHIDSTGEYSYKKVIDHFDKFRFEVFLSKMGFYRTKNLSTKDPESFDGMYHLWQMHTVSEIIGTIHENPELLEKTFKRYNY